MDKDLIGLLIWLRFICFWNLIEHPITDLINSQVEISHSDDLLLLLLLEFILRVEIIQLLRFAQLL